MLRYATLGVIIILASSCSAVSVGGIEDKRLVLSLKTEQGLSDYPLHILSRGNDLAYAVVLLCSLDRMGEHGGGGGDDFVEFYHNSPENTITYFSSTSKLVLGNGVTLKTDPALVIVSQDDNSTQAILKVVSLTERQIEAISAGNVDLIRQNAQATLLLNKIEP